MSRWRNPMAVPGLVGLVALLAAAGGRAGASIPPPGDGGAPAGAVERRLLVGWQPGVPAATRAALHARLDARLLYALPPIGVDVVEVGGARPAAAEAYAAQAAVAFIEPDVAVTLGPNGAPAGRSGTLPAAPSGPNVVPNDPLYAQQWHHQRIHSEPGWDLAKAPGITIAVVDTGIDCVHADLAAACVPGYDFIGLDDDPSDDQGHGTIEAGAAAAAVDNGVGIAGLGWGARLMPVKAMDSRGSGSHGSIAAGVLWAADHGAAVINLSLGGPQTSNTLQEAIDYAVGNGATVVASAGNLGTSTPMYPAAYPNVIAVAATTPADTRAPFSSYGDHLDVAAPGFDILTTTMGGGYGRFDGTSEAAALASGFAALLKAQQPARTPAEIQRLMEQTAEDLGAPGRDPYFGSGLIQVAAALAVALPTPTPSPPATVAPPAGPNPWRLSLLAFADTVGAGGHACPGCDGLFGQGDRWAAAACPLGPIEVVVRTAGGPERVLWRGPLRPAAGGLDSRAVVLLDTPPPYRVTLATTHSPCYEVCPNAAASRLLTQADFDRRAGSHAGAGRLLTIAWPFWSCPAPRSAGSP